MRLERACAHPPTLCQGSVHLLRPARHRLGSPRNGCRERGRALNSPQRARAVHFGFNDTVARAVRYIVSVLLTRSVPRLVARNKE